METSSSLDQFNDLVGSGDVETLREWRLQVGLKELALPAMPVLKRHVDPLPVVVRHARPYWRTRGEICPQFKIDL